jgi:hypothetical protein
MYIISWVYAGPKRKWHKIAQKSGQYSCASFKYLFQTSDFNMLAMNKV